MRAIVTMERTGTQHQKCTQQSLQDVHPLVGDKVNESPVTMEYEGEAFGATNETQFVSKLTPDSTMDIISHTDAPISILESNLAVNAGF
jgi:hypothetical protein